MGIGDGERHLRRRRRLLSIQTHDQVG
jgi:hypothetical protein